MGNLGTVQKVSGYCMEHLGLSEPEHGVAWGREDFPSDVNLRGELSGQEGGGLGGETLEAGRGGRWREEVTYK